ncbi:hypothetical protein IGI04_026409 [Brassica rapa subsp. trilocularis]|uniref:Reverse transcriptase zinc-binding domain-containing protein n=1 Tax=Brassica rapa subsp. trilocularis TaxID=1813537 RepID=A0ABQ7KX76_BRACM|nr:hypothetical protein IGI04_026409 [Brassica rapa subsp. trilocularis]
MWVTNLNRLPTRDRLSSWGMQVPSCCCICTTEPESRDHLMLSCPFVLTLWAEIRIRLRCGVPNFSTWSELMLWASASAPAAPSILKLLVVQTLVYSVWRQRNSMLYSNCISPPLVVFKDINRQVINSIYALRHRKKFRNRLLNWLI